MSKEATNLLEAPDDCYCCIVLFMEKPAQYFAFKRVHKSIRDCLNKPVNFYCTDHICFVWNKQSLIPICPWVRNVDCQLFKEKMITTFPSLVALESAITPENLKYIVKCQQLRKLSIWAVTVDAAIIKELKKLHNLVELRIRGAETMREAYAEISKMKLETLALFARGATDKNLAILSNNCHLKKLEIDTDRVTSMGYAQFARMSNLRSLSIVGDNHVVGTGILLQLHHLSHLSFDMRWVYSWSFSNRPGLPNLKTLRILGWDKDEVRAWVARTMPGCKLL